MNSSGDLYSLESRAAGSRMRKKGSICYASKEKFRMSSGSLATLNDIDAPSGSLLGSSIMANLLKYAMCLMTTIRIDLLLDAVVDTLERNVRRFPFLMGFTFVRTLVKLQHSSNSLLRNVSANSSRHRSNELRSAFSNEQMDHVLSPVTVCPISDVGATSSDGWGHFADFQDEVTQEESNFGFIQQYPLDKTRSQLTSLSTLVETEEDS